MLEEYPRSIRSLPPCVAGESDSYAFEEHGDLAVRFDSSASESDSPAGRAGRGLLVCGDGGSSHGIFFTCHTRWQGSPLFDILQADLPKRC